MTKLTHYDLLQPSSVQRGIIFSRPRILISKERRQKTELTKSAAKSEKTSSTRHTPGYTKGESVNEYTIPKYFESEEGVAFLKTVRTSLRKLVTSCTKFCLI
jgi:hypothetical protein